MKHNLGTMAGEPRQREYLNRTYNLVVLPEGTGADGLIEVPEGMNFAWQDDDGIWFTQSVMGYRDAKIIWQREQPSQVEAPAMMHNRCAMVPIDIKPHQHYFKDVSDVDEIDVYEVLLRFGVTDPCLQHIVKKALCAGERGHKDFHKDLQDIADTAQRMLTIHGV